tara:strand:+ start:2404 stop:2655 length:252 start_codon:yes stop_codon:yes gene_type:complete
MMKITRKQLQKIIHEQFNTEAARDHVTDIFHMYLDEAIRLVRDDISVEQAPALAGITMADFLQAAADRARKQNASELISDYGE